MLLKKYVYIILFFFIHFGINASTFSVSSGNWGQPSTWNIKGPNCGDTIYISEGTTVNVNVQVDFYSTCPTPMFIIIEGTLSFSTGKKILLPCGSGFLVKEGGQVLSGGGGGNSNLIEICNTPAWTSNDGDIIDPISYGTPITEDIVSITTGDWGNPSTWDCSCAPQFYHNVYVDTGDFVTFNSKIYAHNIVINGILDLSPSSSYVEIHGNWLNYGQLIQGESTIEFKGVVSQSISGLNTFHNIIINNTSGVSILGSINLTGTLTLTNGLFNTNNSLTILSNASGTGRIAEITGGSISGNLTMQRYIDAGATNWRFISSAINNPAITQFNDDFETSGYPGSLFPNWPSVANPWPSVYYYDETVGGVQDNGYVAPTSGTNTIGVGEGLWVWCGDTITGTLPFTLDFTGNINTGTISLPVTYTNSGLPTEDGWNMVGNPYPSTLDWDSPNITKTNINNAIYIWNPDLEQFASYVGGFGTNGGSKYIASSQGFWVQANATSPTIQVTESSKSTVDASFLKTTNTLPLVFNTNNSFGADEMIININNDATLLFDPMYDAYKLASTNPNLPYICSVLPNNADLSINQIPAQETTIPIKVLSGVSGIHTITINNIEEYTELSCLFIEDLFTGTTYDLFTQNTFTTFINDSTTIARFLLHIGTTTIVNTINPTCNDTENGVVIIENNSISGFESSLIDNNGNIVSSIGTAFQSDSLVNLSAGTYTLETTDPACGSVTEMITLTAPNEIIADYNFTSTNLDFSFVNTSENGVSYLWDFGDGNTSTDQNPIHTYLNEGTYLVTLTVYQNNECYTSTSQWITILSTSIENNEKDISKAWINNNLLIIANNNNYKSFYIKNAIGQILNTGDFNSNNKTVPLENIESQILFVTLTNENNTETFKLVYTKE